MALIEAVAVARLERWVVVSGVVHMSRNDKGLQFAAIGNDICFTGALGAV